MINVRDMATVMSHGTYFLVKAHILDVEFQAEHYKTCLNGKKFYAYADADIYWESFYPDELKSFAEKAGFLVILCEKGVVYNPVDGTILHCLCINKTE